MVKANRLGLILLVIAALAIVVLIAVVLHHYLKHSRGREAENFTTKAPRSTTATETSTTTPLTSTSTPPSSATMNLTTAVPFSPTATTTSTTTTSVPQTTANPTEAPTTTPLTSTSTLPPSTTLASQTSSTTVMANKNLSCLFVGDMYNFGRNQTAYDQERSFIADTSLSLFDKAIFKAGLSLYGYVEEPFPYLGRYGMQSSFSIFNTSLNRMKYSEDGNGVTTERAISKLNRYKSYKDYGVNCLVFISAKLDTTELPELNPTSMSSSATIVAVGFNGTDLTGIVDQRGTALSVPYEYNATDVQNVVKAVLNT